MPKVKSWSSIYSKYGFSLQIIVKQESTRKMGVAMSPEEEILRSKLENMQALVSAPTQFKVNAI